VGWAAFETATKAGKQLKRTRRLIYKVTADADVMKLVAAEAPKRGWRPRAVALFSFRRAPSSRNLRHVANSRMAIIT
jgi:hypothetical protein